MGKSNKKERKTSKKCKNLHKKERLVSVFKKEAKKIWLFAYLFVPLHPKINNVVCLRTYRTD